MNYENMEIKADGVVLPAPISFELNLEDLDADSERDVVTGILGRNRIRSDVYKISLAYGLDDVVSIKKVLEAISKETFSVELFDIKSGQRKIKTMYAGPKSMQYVCNNGLWIKSLKFNLVEV